MSQEVTTDGVRYRDVAGFPGYRVGDDGSVWSNRRWRGRRPGTWHRLKARPNVTPRPCRQGHYLAVLLHRYVDEVRKQTNRLVHVLVLEAFVGPRPEGAFACHGNGDPQDNRLANLRWDDWMANIEDMRRHGTMLQGEDKHGAKLTDEDVVAIRRLYARGVTPSKMAPIFGVHEGTVRAVVRRTDWKHVASADTDTKL